MIIYIKFIIRKWDKIYEPPNQNAKHSKALKLADFL